MLKGIKCKHKSDIKPTNICPQVDGTHSSKVIALRVPYRLFTLVCKRILE